MHLKRKYINTIIEMASAREMAWLNELLTFSQGSGMARKRVSMIKAAAGKRYIGSGFLRMVKKKADEDGVEIVVNDVRTEPPPPNPIRTQLDVSVPRYYQIEAAKAALNARNGVIELPTGSGKTLTAVMIADALRDMPVLYAVGDGVLADSMRTAYARETGRPVSSDLSKGSFVVVTLQSLYAQLRKSPKVVIKVLKRFRALLIDEAHGVPANTFYKVCAAVPAYYRIGLSATPFDRSDNRTSQIIALFGGLIYRKTEGELAAEGYLPTADIRMVRYTQPSAFVGRYASAYELQVVVDPGRNALIAAMVERAAKPCLVLYSSLDHGPDLAHAIFARGIESKVVDSKANVAQRKDVIKRLNDGRLSVVIASRIFSVGVDVPELRSVVIAGAGKSVIQTVQRVGRGMRITGTKRSFEVWDVLDWTDNLHLANVKKGPKPRGIWIAKHAHARLRTYRTRGHDVRVLETIRGPEKLIKGMIKQRAPRSGSIGAAARSFS
jgi:superfamily II DNA or RNA helicase